VDVTTCPAAIVPERTPPKSSVAVASVVAEIWNLYENADAPPWPRAAR